MPDLAAALRAVLPPRTELAAGQDEPLWLGEVLSRAVPGRLAEFARGRSAARAAMGKLSLSPAAIPMGSDRAPIWPEGITGSISHCKGACFAIVGRRADYQGLGLDIEPTQPLDRDLWATVLRPEEIERDQDPLSTFVAKEAAYKAQYGVTRRLFDFQTLAVDWQGNSFAARFVTEVGPIAEGYRIHGHLVKTADHTAAVCAIRAT
ncbi:MAG: 4'-phosphopantetheinyl transferase family protein [Paracoccaceae bacterium]